MGHHLVNLHVKTIVTSFDLNTAELYDNNILLTMICIVLPEFELKARYFALHLTENAQVFIPTVALHEYLNMQSTLF